MKKPLLLLFLFILAINVYGQDCECERNFEYLYNKIKNNYIGFRDKITDKNKRFFSKFTFKLKSEAKKADSLQCYHILQQLVSYFNDSHLGIYHSNEEMLKRWIARSHKKYENIYLDSNNLYKYFNGKARDKIEGIWEDGNGVYRIGIVKDKNNVGVYYGVVIRADGIFWQTGQIKFKIKRKLNKKYETIVYYPKDHAPLRPMVSVSRDIIKFRDFGNWYRVFPVNKSDTFKRPIIIENSSPSFKKVNINSCLIIIPSFLLDYKKLIDSIIEVNKGVIENTKTLIIDVRNNGGGYVQSYEKLVPYIYTNPLLTEAGSILASTDIINTWKGKLLDTSLSENAILSIKESINKMEDKKGKIIKIWPSDTIKFETIYKYPENVAILANENTGSSAELFLLLARQSKKVLIFGENTHGAIDYLDVSPDFSMPCEFYSYYYATARRSYDHTGPLNNIGISPDVRVPSNIKNWVLFVDQYLESKD
jgi:Peptidase family S41